MWEANHADEVTAKTEAEIDAVFAAMDRHLAHTPWRVAQTDCFTPDAFLARLALDDFDERFVAIQMALKGRPGRSRRVGDASPGRQFRSVVDAVRCAIEVQSGLVERNAGLPPERRIEFRVGIHLGDVVEKVAGDLIGDVVSINVG